MIRTARLLVVFLLSISVANEGLAATEAQATETLEARVDRYLQPYVETGNFSGSVLVAQRTCVLVASPQALSARYGVGARSWDSASSACSSMA